MTLNRLDEEIISFLKIKSRCQLEVSAYLPQSKVQRVPSAIFLIQMHIYDVKMKKK